MCLLQHSLGNPSGKRSERKEKLIETIITAYNLHAGQQIQLHGLKVFLSAAKKPILYALTESPMNYRTYTVPNTKNIVLKILSFFVSFTITCIGNL